MFLMSAEHVADVVFTSVPSVVQVWLHNKFSNYWSFKPTIVVNRIIYKGKLLDASFERVCVNHITH